MIKGLLFVLLLLTVLGVSAQTPGLIIKPATSGSNPLDPNGDGYTSVDATGFQTDDVAESELPFQTTVGLDPLSDPLVGPTGKFNDIVGADAEGNYAVMTYTDGVNLFFRFRMGGYAPNSKTYAIFIDTDQRFGFTGADADPDARPGNPGFELEVSLHTNFSVTAYNVNAPTPVVIATYPGESNYQQSIALTENGASPDYFYDFYVPLAAVGLTTTTPIRFVAATTMNPNNAITSNSLSDFGGQTVGNNIDQIYIDLISPQSPSYPGTEVLVKSECPSITTTLASGVTSISGTTSEAAGTIIDLYVNDVQVGTTTTTSSSWTISFASPLVAGASVYATAQAPNKGLSNYSCNLGFVGATCTEPPIFVSISNGSKGVIVDVIGPSGTVVGLYGPNSNSLYTASGLTNPVTTTATNQRVTIAAQTGQALLAGSYYVTAQAPGFCTSPRTYFCHNGTESTAPTVNSIAPLTNTVTGSGGLTGATIYVFSGTSIIGSKVLTADGNWSVSVPASEICNTTITAKQMVPNYCISAASNAVVVGQAQSAAPTITVSSCASSITTVTGFSVEPDGSTVTLFVNGTQRAGTATVSGGQWSFATTPAITTGQVITARVQSSAACKSLSALSAPVTVQGQSATYTATIASPIVQGATSVSVTYSGVAVSSSINLYIDGYKIGTSTAVSGSGTVAITVASTDLYTGGQLQVTFTQGTQCESTLSAVLATVSCAQPNLAASVISPVLTQKCVTTQGVIQLTNSQTGVIYTPVDAVGTAKGYSTLGTGGTILLNTQAFDAGGVATFYVKAQPIVSFDPACSVVSASSVSFNVWDFPQFTVHPANTVACNNASTSFTATWTGVGPYNVLWEVDRGGGWETITGVVYSGQSATGISTTTSTLSISNASGLSGYKYRCNITDTGVGSECAVSTSNEALLSVETVYFNANVTPSSTGDNGAIAITPFGGSGSYEYDWHHINGAGTFGEVRDLTGLAAGSYILTMRDTYGCEFTGTPIVVSGVGSLIVSQVSVTNVSCYGTSTGSFEVAASFVSDPPAGPLVYEYTLDMVTWQSSGIFTNRPAGVYTVRARETTSGAVSNALVVNVTQPAELLVFAVKSNPSILLNDGSIYVTVVGGTAPFDYVVTKDGSPFSTRTDVSASESFTNLTAGTYSIQVTDANGCIATRSGVLIENPVVSVQSCTYLAAHSFNNPQNTYSGYDGAYNFFNSNWSESGDPDNRIDIVLEALSFGSFSLGNAVNLSGNPSVSRTIDLSNYSTSTSPQISFSYSLARTTNNKDDFGVRLFVNGAASPAWSIAISGSAVTPSTVSLVETTANVDFVNGINTLRFEIYQSGTKYEAASNLRIDDIQISFQKPLSVAYTKTDATNSCATGTINISTSGGFPNASAPFYSYDWSDLGVADDFSDTQNRTALVAGSYSIRVQDSRGCISLPVSIPVNSLSLSGSLAAGAATCAGGGNNGTVTATIPVANQGAGGPFVYELYKLPDSTTPIQTATSGSTVFTFYGLVPGNYLVKLKDVSGCEFQTASVEVILPYVTATLSAVSTDLTLCSGETITAKVQITGGTSPYQVTLSNGQILNNYVSNTNFTITPSSTGTISLSNVTSTDGCLGSLSGSIAVTVHPSPTVTVTGGGTICAGQSATISFNFTGTGPWNYTYTDGTSSFSGTTSSDPYVFAVTTAGTYSVTALSDANCTGTSFTGSATVVVNALPTVLSATGDTRCGEGTLTLTATPSAGTINWYSAATGGTLYLAASTSFAPYMSTTATVYAEAVNAGCASATRTAVTGTVNPIPTGTLSSDDADNSICSGQSVTFSATGGTNYEFFVNGVSVQNSASSDYTTTSLVNNDMVSVQVSNGLCTATDYNTLTMTVTANPTITLGANPTVCIGVTTANLPFTATFGTPTQYVIDWSQAALDAGFVSNTFAFPGSSPIALTVPGGASPNTYSGTLVVYNAGGCFSASYPFSVTVANCNTCFISSPCTDLATTLSNAASGTLITSTGTENNLNLNDNFYFYIPDGVTFTGSISSGSAGSFIIIGETGVFSPSSFNNFSGTIRNYNTTGAPVNINNPFSGTMENYGGVVNFNNNNFNGTCIFINCSGEMNWMSTGNFNLNSTSKIFNSGVITMNSGELQGNGCIQNEGWMTIQSYVGSNNFYNNGRVELLGASLHFNGGIVINNCAFYSEVFGASFQNNTSIENNGLIYLPDGTWETKGGKTFTNNSTGVVRTKDLVNEGTVNGQGGRFYITGSSHNKNNGVFGVAGSFINFYDASPGGATGPFDLTDGGSTIGPNVFFTSYPQPTYSPDLSAYQCGDVVDAVTVTPGSIGSDQTICADTDVAELTSLSAASCSDADAVISYEWESCTDNVNFATIVGATAATYDPVSVSVTTYFKRKALATFSGSKSIFNSSGYSNTITITRSTGTPTVISTQPIAQTICVPNNATFSVVANVADSYQWQVSTDGGTSWGNVANGGAYSGANTATLLLTDPGTGFNGYRYRVEVLNASCGNVMSDEVLLTVTVSCITIVEHPTSQAACDGASASFTTEVDNVTSPVFVWQMFNTVSGTWENLTIAAPYSVDGTVANTSTLTIANVTGLGGRQYRCEITDGAATVQTNAATLTVNALPNATLAVNDATIECGEYGSFNMPVSESGVSYRLYLQDDVTPVGTSVNGTGNQISFTVTPFVNTTYHVWATNTTTNCSVLLSDFPTMIVSPILVSVTDDTADPNSCPDFLEPFNANTDSYNAGSTLVSFKVTRTATPSSSWGFYYNIPVGTVYASTGSLQAGTINVTPGNTDLLIGVASAIINVDQSVSEVILRFYITNTPGAAQTIQLVVDDLWDVNCTNPTISVSGTHNISAMPAIGGFN